MRYIISSALSILPLASLPFAAMAEVPRVITDIPPIYGLVAQVMGDLGQPVLLLEKGADEHDFQLRPSQMGDIADADLTVWVGPTLTPWLERALSGAKGEMVSLPLLDMPMTKRLEFAAKDAGKLEHAHNGIDPHAWLNPENAAIWLDTIALALSAKDSENAATYSANAADAKADIAALDGELGAALAEVKDKGFVAYHDAYQYFTAHYGLNYRGAVTMGDASAAGAAHLREMQTRIAKDVVCVFPEVQHDADLLLQLTEGTAVKAGAPLDPAGAALTPSRSSYTDVLSNLTAALKGCLAGT
jgi:zinc transport system substrate-binding protein